MTEDHQPIPVKGYKPQSPESVALVNSFKEDEERLLRKLDDMLLESGKGIGKVNWEPKYDGRWLAVAKTHFEQGFMALNRAVFQPGRIALPEDEPK